MSIIFPIKYFKNINNYWMFDREKYQKLVKKSSNVINRMPIAFIKEILNDPKLYTYVYDCFTTKNKNIAFYSIEKNIEDTSVDLEYNKKDFLNILKHLLETKKLSDREKKNIEKLIKTNEYTFFKENLLEAEAIPNIKYKDIIALLSKDKEELDETLKSETIFGVTKEELVVILTKPPFNFSSDRNLSLLESFNFDSSLSQKIIENFEHIKYLYSIDGLAKFPFEKGNFDINEVNINSKLKTELLDEIPKEYSKIQKIYFIYRRLCQKFSYDEEYFAGLQKQMYSINHKDINRLTKLNEDNNIVICYEITMILAKFCQILNIPFIILNKANEEFQNYGSGHTKLKFKVDDFVIVADPAHGIIHSDIATEKIYNKVENFKLCNTNQRTIDNYSKYIKQVDEYFNQNKKTFAFEDIKKIYNFNNYRNKVEITNGERIELFLSIIKKTETSMIDSLGYFLDTKKRIFNEDKEKFCKCVYVCNNEKIDFQKEITASLIIIYNEDYDVELIPEQNKHIIVNSNKQIKAISYGALQELFNNQTLKYINPKNMIPGITINEMGEENYEQENNFNEHQRKA